MFDLAQRALDAARAAGADYADVRLQERREQALRWRNGAQQESHDTEGFGVGVRVLVDGAWGFASGNDLRPAAIETVAQRAVEVGRASAQVAHDPVRLAATVPVRARWTSPCREDPFTVTFDEKAAILREAERLLRQVGGVRATSATFQAFRTHQYFASSDGSEIEQTRTECGAGMMATASGNGETQQRSFPMRWEGLYQLGGFEVIREIDLPGNAEQTAREAVALVNADPCPTDQLDLVIDGSHMALQVHESCGHPTEADRAFGMEAAYAGNTFLTLDKRGAFRYGSDAVTIVADATSARGLGTFAYDDEGVPGQAYPLIDRGLFANYLSSRETAPRLGLTDSSGAMRASGWNRLPLIRMTNINLNPGDFTLDELIRGVKRGLFLATTKSWSIDDVRLNFQFATEVGYEIRDGSLGRLLRNCTYQGITPEFWNTCDGVGNRNEWRMWGTLRCGKGEPSQSMHVGHGTAPARFRGVRVGILSEGG